VSAEDEARALLVAVETGGQLVCLTVRGLDAERGEEVGERENAWGGPDLVRRSTQ